jgi:CBS domain-containing protein
VYDYTAGKQDWAAFGLPVEGTAAEQPRAIDVMRTDVPTCHLGDRLADVLPMVEKAEWNVCVVVNDERIVLGLLRAKELASGDEKTAEEAMRPGPSTFRPNVAIEQMAEHMIEHDLESAPITTPEGRLMGMLRRQDAAKVALEVHHHHHAEEEEEG